MKHLAEARATFLRVLQRAGALQVFIPGTDTERGDIMAGEVGSYLISKVCGYGKLWRHPGMIGLLTKSVVLQLLKH